MSKDKTGDSAFPQTISFSGDGSGFVSSDELGCGGMTLRDYFAAKAMQALIAKCDGEDHCLQNIPEDSFDYADAMLAERAK